MHTNHMSGQPIWQMSKNIWNKNILLNIQRNCYMIILREFLKKKRWYNEEIKIGKFCDILYITGSKSDLLVYTGQKRRPDRTGHYNGSAMLPMKIFYKE